MFNGSIQCLPWNSSIPFPPQWPLQVHFVDWQHLVLTQDIIFAMKIILHEMHHAPMSPPKVASALRPFPLITPL